MSGTTVFAKGDRVVVRKLIKNYHFVKDAFNQRQPKAGDIAVVVEVYEGPPRGYRLECCDSSGGRIWMLGFTSEEVELERLSQ